MDSTKKIEFVIPPYQTGSSLNKFSREGFGVELTRNNNTLFLFGPNGTGKTALLQTFFRHHRSSAVWVNAQRQVWLSDSHLNMTSRQYKKETENIAANSAKEESRYQPVGARVRPLLSLFSLVDKCNRQNEKLRKLTDGNVTEQEIRNFKDNNPYPFDILSQIFQASSLPIRFELSDDDLATIVAYRTDSIGLQSYFTDKLSDGERNALLLAADILGAESDSLFLLDEPELHLHPSISAPFLANVIDSRPDCFFVIATHDTALPEYCRPYKTFVLHSCQVRDNSIVGWDGRLIEGDNDLDESVRRAVFGGRKTLLVVEGDSSSLDRMLYAGLFPDVTIHSVGSKGEVKEIVNGLTSAEQWTWINAIGLIDGDLDDPEEDVNVGSDQLNRLSVYSVENLLYDLTVQRSVGGLRAQQKDESIDEWIELGCAAAFENAHSYVEKSDNLAVDVERKEILALILEAQDYEVFLRDFPLKYAGIRLAIAKALDFRTQEDYERAAIKAIASQDSLKSHIKSKLGNLPSQLGH